ncbi:ribonuclease HII [Tahibacter amnicola]|uniref:Ribonuclease HII n=2 Tax=Tahibacter amnicola TaxID=2976241 RepID=A0ABY6BCA7_9GAMM|nr:ribonuclease HII [Tahibacter amnicola]UXI66808.1 ribonuclease HII [Tahibacter amnicola]
MTKAARSRLHVAGVDEAGRGPLAGPVLVAAVILDPKKPIDGLADSKQLTEARREALEPLIRERALAYSIVEVDVEAIDRLNIFHATMHGMAQALVQLAIEPALALIDGNHLPKNLRCDARAVVGGDALEPAISAASILAKVTRDRLMVALDERHPGYGFSSHKGYGTPEHLDALRRLGPCLAHRRSFAPVQATLQPSLF